MAPHNCSPKYTHSPSAISTYRWAPVPKLGLQDDYILYTQSVYFDTILKHEYIRNCESFHVHAVLYPNTAIKDTPSRAHHREEHSNWSSCMAYYPCTLMHASLHLSINHQPLDVPFWDGEKRPHRCPPYRT